MRDDPDLHRDPSSGAARAAHLAQHGTRDPHALEGSRPSGSRRPTRLGGEASRLEADPADAYTGLVVDDRYVVEGIIGEGGMGRVYQCRHRTLGKKLAMKIIRSDIAQHPDAGQRFSIEAKAASAIGNQHIIDIIDFGALPDGAAYSVMELLEGVSLATLLEQQPTLPLARVVDIIGQIAEGLAAAHAAGIVHRDLKPDNVFIVDQDGTDFVKILDFGVAKMAEADAVKITHAGTVVGTPHYMSPEQALGGAVDRRCDIYALGVIFYELVAGCVPFDAEHFLGVLSQHQLQPPPPFRTLRPPVDAPPELEAIILRCLAKSPEQRYASMTELLAELDLALPMDAAALSAAPERRGHRSVPTLSLPFVPSRRSRFSRARHASRAAAALAAVALAAWGVGAALNRSPRAEPERVSVARPEAAVASARPAPPEPGPRLPAAPEPAPAEPVVELAAQPMELAAQPVAEAPPPVSSTRPAAVERTPRVTPRARRRAAPTSSGSRATAPPRRAREEFMDPWPAPR